MIGRRGGMATWERKGRDHEGQDGEDAAASSGRNESIGTNVRPGRRPLGAVVEAGENGPGAYRGLQFTEAAL